MPIHGDASAKAALYRDRFLLLSQRLYRDQHFSKPVFHTERSHSGSCEVLSGFDSTRINNLHLSKLDVLLLVNERISGLLKAFCLIKVPNPTFSYLLF